MRRESNPSGVNKMGNQEAQMGFCLYRESGLGVGSHPHPL